MTVDNTRWELDMTERVALVVAPDDNVATLMDDARDITRAAGLDIAPCIPFGHKIALTAITAGTPVIKFGVVIGRATQGIAAGEHVHVHNLR